MFAVVVAASLLIPLSTLAWVAIYGTRRSRRPKRRAAFNEPTLRMVRPHSWVLVGGAAE